MTPIQTTTLRDSKIGDWLKPLMFALCRQLASVRLFFNQGFTAASQSLGLTSKIFTKRFVLFVGTSEVTVDFLLSIDTLIHDLANYDASLLVSRSCQKFAQTKLAEHERSMTLTGMVRASCFPWDLIIFSDHNNATWFHDAIPKIYCTHGIDYGKTIEGRGNYTYGQNSLNHHGQSLYDLMFVESTYHQTLFTQHNPALRGHTAVVGNLMADDLLATMKERTALYQQVGAAKSQHVLLICSTWGPHSLVQRMGRALLYEVVALADVYKIFLFIHPMNFRTEFPGQGAFKELITTYEHDGLLKWIKPSETAVPYLVAADVMLSDHTSLSLYYALLNKPHFYISLTENLMEGSLIRKFYSLQPPYDPDLPLGIQIEQVIHHFPIEQHKALAQTVVDERGNAKQRIKEEIAKFVSG